jgi:adenylate cyclase, class 2
VLVTLDEMPYGSFTELEGPNPQTIFETARRVGLTWEARSADSYLTIFMRFKAHRGMVMPHLCFAEFKGITFAPEDLGLKYAD